MMQLQENAMKPNVYVDQKLATQFKMITDAPFDIVHQTLITFAEDKNPDKINLCVGAYRDQQGKPYVFEVVSKAEQEMVKEINKEYLSDFYKPFTEAARLVLFGKQSKFLKDERIVTMQTVSGTGALYMGFYFIANFLPQTPRKIYLSDPTWATHPDVVQTSALTVGWYPYYNPQTKGLDFNRLINFFDTIQLGSVIVLQPSGHNPTGCDPSKQQWIQICEVMKKRNLIPFFDPAYQGFSSGDLDEDVWAVRYFLEQGFFMLIAQSFSKNLGLYGDRIGALHIVAPDKQSAWNAYTKVRSQARKIYLSPPSHGSYVVDRVVNNESNYKQWLIELKDKVVATIKKGRKLLRDQLERIQTPGSWKHITEQTGMFSFSGLTEEQCEILMKKYHIYLIKNGRISASLINQNNYKRIAQSIKMTIEETLQEHQ